MRIKALFKAFVIVLLFSFLSLNARAESVDIKKMIQGTVKEVKADSIKILGANDSQDQVTINTNTVYDNIQKWSDLKAGDKVQIECRQDHGKSVAITITKIAAEGEDNL